MESNLSTLLTNYLTKENNLRHDFLKLLLEQNAKTEATHEYFPNTAALWRKQSKPALTELGTLATSINQRFFDLTLFDALKLFHYFIGFHEEVFSKYENDHPISFLLNDGSYNFERTSKYVHNLYQGHHKQNNLRLEMCLGYLFIFLSRLSFTPFNLHQSEVFAELDFDPTLKEIAITDTKDINLRFMSLRNQFLKSIPRPWRNCHDLTQPELQSFIEEGLTLLSYLLGIAIQLKKQGIITDLQILRPSVRRQNILE